MSTGKVFSDCPYSRRGHDGVSDPVRGSDKQLFDMFALNRFSIHFLMEHRIYEISNFKHQTPNKFQISNAKFQTGLKQPISYFGFSSIDENIFFNSLASCIRFWPSLVFFKIIHWFVVWSFGH